jgi:histidyl-tRNA synthetase
MARTSFQTPRGTRDLFPEDLVLIKHLERIARELARSSGYAEIRPPLFEDTRLFTRSLGETSDVVAKEMFSVPRRGESTADSFTFRPEGTAGVARAYVNGGFAARAPLQKWYYLGPMFRYERPQKGRERQFSQFGIEAFGSASAGLDAEIVDLAMRFFERLGFGSELEVRVNTMGDPSDRDLWREQLRSYFAPNLEGRCEDCRNRFERNVFRLLDCKVSQCIAANLGAPQLSGVMGEESRQHHQDFLQALQALGYSPIQDSSIVRGLDYYTRTVFEVHYPPLGARSALCGGGRYDGLVAEVGGAPTPAVGFAIGFTATELALQELGLPAEQDLATLRAELAPTAYVVAIGAEDRHPVLALAAQLRLAGLPSVVVDHRGKSLKAQMKEANRSGSRFAILLGPDERAANQAVLRDLTEGLEQTVAQSELAAAMGFSRPV